MAKVGEINARTENIQVKTRSESFDILQRRAELAAGLENTQADTEGKRVNTMATLNELLNPPEPKPVAEEGGFR